MSSQIKGNFLINDFSFKHVLRLKSNKQVKNPLGIGEISPKWEVIKKKKNYVKRQNRVKVSWVNIVATNCKTNISRYTRKKENENLLKSTSASLSLCRFKNKKKKALSIMYIILLIKNLKKNFLRFILFNLCKKQKQKKKEQSHIKWRITDLRRWMQ